MHWSLPQDCLQPTSSDSAYQHHTLWLRAAQDPLVFESVSSCVQLANWEGKNDDSYCSLDSRAMLCPTGASKNRIDPHSIFGRAPFEVQKVDAGWLLEHSNGAPLGYVHVEWAIHTPTRPELDPTLGLEVTLHEIMIRPSLRGHGLGKILIDKSIEAMAQHVDLLLASYGRLRGLSWQFRCDAETISQQGQWALERLNARVDTLLEKQSDYNSSTHSFGQWA